MTVFVSAVYIISCVIYRRHINRGDINVKIDDICRYGIAAQQIANKKNIDVVFQNERHRILNALMEYKYYFACDCDIDGEVKTVRLNTSDVRDLEYKFLAYLPTELIDILFEVVDRDLSGGTDE